MNKHVQRAIQSLTMASLGLFLIRLLVNNNIDYWYLVWNLLLAFVPLVLIIYIVKWLKNHRLSHPGTIALLFTWLIFLPNSFYIITDYIHLLDTKTTSLMLDIVMVFMFSLTGLIAGFASVYIFEKLLAKRYSHKSVQAVSMSIFLVCSFAIYLGRYLRWNSWDLALNPIGIVFDVSDRLINPAAYSLTFSTTAIFFLFISSLYFAGIYTLKADKK